jgi:GT2 family glycosyltransferase
MMIDLSIVIPTVNRAAFLDRAIHAIRQDTQCAYEVIVVDGASTDHTRQVLEHAGQLLGDRLKVIREDHREGFVKAANKGFRAATGRNMTWLNDDARPMPGAYDLAVSQIDSSDHGVAFLAMFHRWHSTRNVAYETVMNGQNYRLCHVRGTLYANFAMGRRETYERLNYFDERYFLYAADPDLSLKAWDAGMRVEPAYLAVIEHDEHEDDRRLVDSDRGAMDNERLFAKWDLPAKNLYRNDFNPQKPCTLRGQRQQDFSERAAA